MSDTDSFIDEVTEEVRRDRLYATLRKYGWIAGLVVVALVGGASYNEYRKASDRSAAQSTGDAILSALDEATPEARMAGLEGVEGAPELQGVLALLTAAEALAAEDPEAAAALLKPLAEDSAAPQAYSDLAALKMVLIDAESMTADLRSQVLNRLAKPGAPYRALAMEQQVLDLAAAGQTEDAIEAGRVLLEEPSLTQGLLQRVSQLMLALGAEDENEAG
ncbi:hypothetical protein CLV78_101336 [Aliiruegeria haliotis]|uniref:Tetratricopeptide repeat-like domain-containing protein n=1 Tax=Aliiruegeria haliotis TaxID=1280846 RepID=A0A2T0RYI4_9RHOB|nr:hypothetical protein [Aliiruegeria haliotis]PRY26241.1 hypothetical protein CLV78_101336 [Aliiruegeria haliotis]